MNFERIIKYLVPNIHGLIAWELHPPKFTNHNQIRKAISKIQIKYVRRHVFQSYTRQFSASDPTKLQQVQLFNHCLQLIQRKILSKEEQHAKNGRVYKFSKKFRPRGY